MSVLVALAVIVFWHSRQTDHRSSFGLWAVSLVTTFVGWLGHNSGWRTLHARTLLQKYGMFATFLWNYALDISVLFPSFCIIQRVGSARLPGQIISSASLGSLSLRAHNLPAWLVVRSGLPAGILVGGVMTPRKRLFCGEILEKMHFHFFLFFNLTFKIKIKHIM